MATQYRIRETAKCFGLVFLGIILLPFSALVSFVCLSGTRKYYGPRSCAGPRAEGLSRSPQKTILVTGVGMAKGLALARSFYISGHHIVGADFEDRGSLCPGRYSRSLSAFYSLSHTDNNKTAETYLSQLLKIIKTEKIDIWVSCSGVANAIQDAHAKELIEQHTSCKCIQFGVETTSALHDKGSFMEECRKRNLPVPETHEIKSSHDILQILSASKTYTPERRFILKPNGLDDINRGNMTLLPLQREEDTRAYSSRLPISEYNPWILQQFIPGGEEYCTHSLVIRGKVKCFVACPSGELLMHYKPLSSDSSLWKAMLAFTVEFVQRSENPEDMTGHLSFDFMVSDGVATHYGFERRIYAIECNPRAHTAVVLFAQRGLEMETMTSAYLSAINTSSSKTDGNSLNEQIHTDINGPIVPPVNAQPRYWIGHDLVYLLIHPILSWCVGSVDFSIIFSDIVEFCRHLFTWKEGIFEVWDPLPELFLYHIYWPRIILSAWWHGKHWSRVNVSTTKMFACE